MKPNETELRKQKLEEWVGKGAEWCATQLWQTRRNLEKARRRETEARHEKWKLQAQSDIDYHALTRANATMANVLRENGIRPTKLRITYVDADCENCEYYDRDEERCTDEFGGCDDDYLYKKQICTTSISFYTYLISGDRLDGITAQFEDKHYSLIKVVDERSGDVLFELKDEEAT